MINFSERENIVSVICFKSIKIKIKNTTLGRVPKKNHIKKQNIYP